MKQLVDWLNSEIGSRHLSGHVYQSLIRQDGNWYYVPVYVDMRDAYDKATLLQQIEDEWERQQVQPGRNLLLIPSAKGAAARE